MASVYLYIPNLIGYFRLILIMICWLFFNDYLVFLPMYTLQMSLDGIDGFLARRLDQCSKFGAWLDVFCDNVGRTLLWYNVHEAGFFVLCLEWTVFVCTHSIGPDWKNYNRQMPRLVSAVMYNGFFNPLGAYVIGGVHGLPLALYMYSMAPYNYQWLSLLAAYVLTPARIIAGIAEIWFIYAHIDHMVQDKH